MRQKRSAILPASLATVLLTAMSVLVHPWGPVKASHSSQDLFAGAQIDNRVRGVFERSCQNCHSEKTHWPWYSYIAPASLLVESDVGRARRRMNLSKWNGYSMEYRQALLMEIAVAVRSREMPPSRYSLVHPEAGLADAERDLMAGWARGEEQRLRALASTPSGD